MEIRTCEQYVLSELEAAREENEKLLKENVRLHARVGLLESKLNAAPGALDEHVEKRGREDVFRECTFASITVARYDDGKPVPFRIWCEESMRDYRRPKGVSVDEFIRYFEPEFREAYRKKVGEGEGEA